MSVERCVVLILAEDRTSVFKWRVDAPKEIVCNQLVATARRLIATNGKPGSASTYEGEVDFVSVDDDTTRIPVETVIEGSVSRAKIRACQERPDGDTPSVTLSAFSKAEGLEKHFAKKLHISPPTASTTPAPNKPPSLARGTGGGTSLLNPDAARAVGPRYHANPVGHGSASQQKFMEQMASKDPKRTSKRLSADEVALHTEPDDCWVILNGMVYEVSDYLKFHPGGKAILLGVAGSDCTSQFNKHHRWVNGHGLLSNCCLGKVEFSPRLLNGTKAETLQE
eukprot:GHVN01029049.1.p1 GENE.GHVN01029049.1~~GHVN01029049.1.p1  ORF type:complete len:281 (+),score=15.19 GHVN01029049.1:186-1028(+)